ncbi:M99 family carboxypeptidase catalytic domain-containing protein [Desulfocurvibacter africanus]|uniref:M99 family carboxypeptidase catalytic domain-containing protein n=1 Tax=Desulfocurvibacter africanus TaxID=873 RepID=UPI0004803D6C
MPFPCSVRLVQWLTRYVRWPRAVYRQVTSALLVLAALLVVARPATGAEFTIFQGTQYPLRVYILEGAKPGPTVMVQGGIQGDEIAGFLTAQQLTHAKLDNGRLIIIPRANVPSIHKRQRQINVDLNRRFDRDYNEFYEDHLARAIRFFLAQADAFIHLHEGSGFYNPVWVDNLRNPRRYGQSIIIDTPVFENRIFLANYVNSVLDRLNQPITTADFRFRLFSTDTFRPDSPHAEQLKSLTCYALKNRSIPAFAIEVSKDIVQVEWKVSQQLRATVLLLEQFGLHLQVADQDTLIEQARIVAPVLRVGAQSVGSTRPAPLKLLSYEPLALTAEDLGLTNAQVKAGAAGAVGVFASDRPEINLLETPRLPLIPFRSLEVRADGTTLTSIPVEWAGTWPKAEPGQTPWFVCWHNGSLRIIPAGRTLEAVVGDQLVLEGIHGGKDEVLNLKGFIANRTLNDGQDSGPEIILDPSMFLQHWLVPTDKPDEWLCRVARETPSQSRDEFFIRIVPRRLKALVLQAEDGRRIVLDWRAGEATLLASGRYTLAEAWSNGARDKLLALAGQTPLPWGDSFELKSGERLELSLRQMTTFSPISSMTLISETPAQSKAPAQSEMLGDNS